MATLKLPITERAKKYGFIFWTKKAEEDVRKFLKDADRVSVWFENSFLGEKRVDWKYRRISLGWKRTRELKEAIQFFRVTLKKDSSIQVVCE